MRVDPVKLAIQWLSAILGQVFGQGRHGMNLKTAIHGLTAEMADWDVMRAVVYTAVLRGELWDKV